VSGYTNPKTAHQYRAELSALFAYSGAPHPRLLNDAAVNQWVALVPGAAVWDPALPKDRGMLTRSAPDAGQPVPTATRRTAGACSYTRHRPGRGPGSTTAWLGGRGQKGSHVQLKHPVRAGRVTVPVHAGETIGPGLLRSILAQAGLSSDEFAAAL